MLECSFVVILTGRERQYVLTLANAITSQFRSSSDIRIETMMRSIICREKGLFCYIVNYWGCILYKKLNFRDVFIAKGKVSLFKIVTVLTSDPSNIIS